MSELVMSACLASDGMLIAPDSYEKTMVYDVDGNLSTTTITAHNGNTYTQTLTWTAGKVTKMSRWVKQ